MCFCKRTKRHVARMFLRFLTEEGRKVRNISSVGREEEAGRDGGQERIHSVDDLRNGGIGGVDGGGISGIEIERDSFGRPVAEIKRQGVFGDSGQALTDRKRLTERVFETSFSFFFSPKVQCPGRPILLTH